MAAAFYVGDQSTVLVPAAAFYSPFAAATADPVALLLQLLLAPFIMVPPHATASKASKGTSCYGPTPDGNLLLSTRRSQKVTIITA